MPVNFTEVKAVVKRKFRRSHHATTGCSFCVLGRPMCSSHRWGQWESKQNVARSYSYPRDSKIDKARERHLPSASSKFVEGSYPVTRLMRAVIQAVEGRSQPGSKQAIKRPYNLFIGTWSCQKIGYKTPIVMIIWPPQTTISRGMQTPILSKTTDAYSWMV